MPQRRADDGAAVDAEAATTEGILPRCHAALPP